MFDSDVHEQLKAAFAPLDTSIVLRYIASPHDEQNSLLELFSGLAAAHPKIRFEVAPDSRTSPVPSFGIEVDGRKTGISFRGVPGGHEFSSLILAILNAGGKGKFPDAFITERIRRIKGPVRVRTYVSLSCENCPDVVQMLNQMALLHPDFRHEMVEGSIAQSEIDALSIQGVPAVFAGENMLVHSGRGVLLDLVTKLEKQFGIDTAIPEQTALSKDLGHFDVVVVGGGPAGAAAAIYTVRKGLKTALISEKIGGQVQETRAIENLISVPLTHGPELAAQLGLHVSKYPIQVFENRRVAKLADAATSKKVLHLDSGEMITSANLIIATGAKWRELGVPGEKEYLGRGVAFCPHCDGPFYKDKKVAVIGGGNSGVEAAIDLAGVVKEVVLLEFGPGLKADQILIDKLQSLQNASILVNAKTQEILGNGHKVIALVYQDRPSEQTRKIELDGVFVQIGLLPNSGFIRDQVKTTPFGEIVVDEKGRTSTTGIYAAGDVTTTPYKQIIIAMGEGAKAALGLFEDRMKAPMQ